jgi:pimeloyl-ACP methyl ester carboxylesterase
MTAAALLLAVVSPRGIASGTSEEVAYATPDAFRVLATYYRPDSGSTGAIVILPDPQEGRAMWGALAESLRTTGFHVLVADLRGAGQSVVQRGVRRERSRFTRSEIANAGLDAEAARRYLLELPDTKIRSIALLASGSGAMAAFRGRNAAEEMSCRVLISPSPDEDTDWDGARPGGEGDLLVIVTNHDLVGIDAAAALVPKDGSRECWMVDGTDRGAALFAARSDLVHPLIRWIRESLAFP